LTIVKPPANKLLRVSEGSQLDVRVTLDNECNEDDIVLNKFFISISVEHGHSLHEICLFGHDDNGTCITSHKTGSHCECSTSEDGEINS
jgi:hypothetical protein